MIKLSEVKRCWFQGEEQKSIWLGGEKIWTKPSQPTSSAVYWTPSGVPNQVPSEWATWWRNIYFGNSADGSKLIYGPTNVNNYRFALLHSPPGNVAGPLRTRVRGIFQSNGVAGLGMNIGGAYSSRNAFTLLLGSNLSLNAYRAGADTVLATTSFPLTAGANELYLEMYQATGYNFEGRVWSPGSSRPTTPNITAKTNALAAGTVGIVNNSSTTVPAFQLLEFAYTTDGTEIPS